MSNVSAKREQKVEKEKRTRNTQWIEKRSAHKTKNNKEATCCSLMLN